MIWVWIKSCEHTVKLTLLPPNLAWTCSGFDCTLFVIYWNIKLCAANEKLSFRRKRSTLYSLKLLGLMLWRVRRCHPVSNDWHDPTPHLRGEVLFSNGVYSCSLENWWQCLPKKGQWGSSNRLIYYTWWWKQQLSHSVNKLSFSHAGGEALLMVVVVGWSRVKSINTSGLQRMNFNEFCDLSDSWWQWVLWCWYWFGFQELLDILPWNLVNKIMIPSGWMITLVIPLSGQHDVHLSLSDTF